MFTSRFLHLQLAEPFCEEIASCAHVTRWVPHLFSCIRRAPLRPHPLARISAVHRA